MLACLYVFYKKKWKRNTIFCPAQCIREVNLRSCFTFSAKRSHLLLEIKCCRKASVALLEPLRLSQGSYVHFLFSLRPVIYFELLLNFVLIFKLLKKPKPRWPSSALLLRAYCLLCFIKNIPFLKKSCRSSVIKASFRIYNDTFFDFPDHCSHAFLKAIQS